VNDFSGVGMNFWNCSQFSFWLPIMILAVGAVLAALIASLTLTLRGKDKNVVAMSAQSMKQSPKKKNLGNVHIKQEDMNQNQKKKNLSYHFKILKLKPNIEVSQIDAMPGNDGYAQDLFNHITDKNGFREFGPPTKN
jgi:hypothetical protein